MVHKYVWTNDRKMAIESIIATLNNRVSDLEYNMERVYGEDSDTRAEVKDMKRDISVLEIIKKEK